jgi:hypothetical protein
MKNYKECVTESGLVLLQLPDLIELLEIKLAYLKEAKEKNSSWNYGIEELESEINYLKQKL